MWGYIHIPCAYDPQNGHDYLSQPENEVRDGVRVRREDDELEGDPPHQDHPAHCGGDGCEPVPTHNEDSGDQLSQTIDDKEKHTRPECRGKEDGREWQHLHKGQKAPHPQPVGDEPEHERTGHRPDSDE